MLAHRVETLAELREAVDGLGYPVVLKALGMLHKSDAGGVAVGLVDDEGLPRRGRVDSVGTRFDPKTDTLRCRAVVPNPDGLLLPGLFAHVRLATSAPFRALLVAEDAMMSDQEGVYLFVVNDRDVVERRAVKLGQLHDGLRAVKQGLQDDEWVVVDGLKALKPGMTVAPERVEMPTGSPAPHNRRGN